MDDYTGDQVLRWYERLENALLDFQTHVPLTLDNESLKVPVLASVLLDAGGLVDSVFRDLTWDPAPNAKRRDECRIDDFARFYAGIFSLPYTKSMLLTWPARLRNPFGPWADILAGSGYTPLPWWRGYNKLKHDRLRNLSACTVGVALDALCALHQVLSRRQDMARLLVKAGWWPLCGWNPEVIFQETDDWSLRSGTWVVQTKLFATPVGPNQFHDDVLKEPRLLLASFHMKAELRDFFGVF
jgi:hypothetical protein